MCIDLDLFGQVIVTFSDVELWLEKVSPLSADNLPNRVKGYIKDYDIASKIAAAKLSGDFYQLERPRHGYDLDLIKSVFYRLKHPAPTPKPAQCPGYFHRCENPLCHVFQSNLKKDRNRAHNDNYSKKKKAERAAWLDKMGQVLSRAA